MSDIDITIQSSSEMTVKAISPLSKSTKNTSILELWSEKEVILPHWGVAFDHQLDERIHFKMTIAE
jgi:hypothetical protein